MGKGLSGVVQPAQQMGFEHGGAHSLVRRERTGGIG